MYIYPSQPNKDEPVQTSEHIDIHRRLQPLYEYLQSSKRIIDIENYDPDILQIFSRDVLKKIRNGKPGWEKALPAYVDNIIRDHGLFGYQGEKQSGKKEKVN